MSPSLPGADGRHVLDIGDEDITAALGHAAALRSVDEVLATQARIAAAGDLFPDAGPDCEVDLCAGRDWSIHADQSATRRVGDLDLTDLAAVAEHAAADPAYAAAVLPHLAAVLALGLAVTGAPTLDAMLRSY